MFSSSSQVSLPEGFQSVDEEDDREQTKIIDIKDIPMDKEQAIAAVSIDLNVPPDWLRALVKFESNDDPKARNKVTGARGLIQFLHSTARSIGFKDADDLVNQYPDYPSQLLNPVLKYLRQFKPFPTKQSLYMSVFYPAARNWTADTVFPDTVRAANPNIDTVGDYVAFVEKRRIPIVKTAGTILLIGVVCVAGYFIYQHYQKKGGSLWQTDEQTDRPQIELM